MACADAHPPKYGTIGAGAKHANRPRRDDVERGGPLTENPRASWANVNVGTDERKWLSFGVSVGHDWNERGTFGTSGDLSMTVKPLSSLSISMGPSLGRSRNVSQYIQTEDDATAVATFGKRYVFSTIDQKQLTLQTRVNWILNPNVSLQVYMQPLLATG